MKEKAPINVVVGKLVDPTEIETAPRERVNLDECTWQGRAMWSYLRLVYGRKIDDTIKQRLEEEKEQLASKGEAMKEVFIDLHKPNDQPLQFIMSANEVVGVATMKHLLIPPEQVYATARQILGFSPSSSEAQGSNLYGQTFETEQGFAGIKTGVQIDGGDLTTRFAIRVGVFARVELCFNPLSWLGVGGLGRFAVPSEYERVLRIKKLNELFPRLKASIENAQEHLSDLKAKVDHAKTVSVSSPTATRLTGAMGMAYGLGAKTIRQVLDRWKDEDKTQYGLAMSQSWTAQHGEHRKTPEAQINRVPQSLSTMSGATLLIDDVKKAEAKCRQWLKDQKSKLAEDLLSGKLP